MTLAHINGDVMAIVHYNSTLMGHLDRPTSQLATTSEPLYHAQPICRGNHRSMIFRSSTQLTITARWYSDTTNQSVTTPMIALCLSGTTPLPAGHNMALNR
ncbi:hypothetical protein F511_42284 [Dorcoceras hygrometricum]|uniref:Uncharacterized protein n=1 Tax=Dorcoceras hygrometricum TaxID=472368 RepID=A0A2Z7D583_9LAMI|nr:hypothetical protein F511_42284 [Dorcoceras hygrometricum]